MLLRQWVSKESTNAQGHNDSFTHKYSLGQIDSPNVISNESVHEFDILIPEIDGPHSQAGENFSIAWSIEVRLYISWAKDPVIRVPIEIVPSPGGVSPADKPPRQ